MRQVMVRYRVKAGREVRTRRWCAPSTRSSRALEPEGFRYATFRFDDRAFVHFAAHRGRRPRAAPGARRVQGVHARHRRALRRAGSRHGPAQGGLVPTLIDRGACASSSPAARAISARRSMRVLGAEGRTSSGSTSSPSPYTTIVGSIADRALRAALHAMASTPCCTPPRCTSRTSPRTRAQDFVDTNITGTLESARGGGRGRRARVRLHEHDERVRPRAGAAAGRAGRVDHRGRRAGAEEHLRRDEGRRRGPVRARPSRPRPAVHRAAHVALLPRGRRSRRRARRLRRPEREGQRVAVPARRHRGRRERAPAALERAPEIGFGRYIISATTPFTRETCAELRADAPAVVRRHVPGYEEVYAQRGWTMFPSIERVYDNARAREELGWAPRYDFGERSSALAGAARIRAASLRGRSAPRATTRSRPGRTRFGAKKSPTICRYLAHGSSASVLRCARHSRLIRLHRRAGARVPASSSAMSSSSRASPHVTRSRPRLSRGARRASSSVRC